MFQQNCATKSKHQYMAQDNSETICLDQANALRRQLNLICNFTN